ncbi:hypothetical protein [Aquabacterium sp.]|uniref:hypothetical protein n=1 Tax=Aquabacterium sp. TaxID=1872578 RepID=UPI0037840A66
MKHKQLSLSLAFASVALLGGCFGGGGDDSMPAPPPPAPAPAPADPLAAVPDSAKQSADGLVGYLKTLSANTTDTREAIDVTGLSLPQSDTTEPSPL